MTAPAFRQIETASYPRTDVPQSIGRPPKLEWIAIRALVVDPEYQRDIGRRGRLNVLRIAAAFSWSKFSTVIVAGVGGGKYAIVDGQHRVTAAAICGLDKVPCQVIEAARAEQADVFAAVNTVITAMSPLQVHAAKLAAGDEKAGQLAAVCAAADVTICRYPVPANKMKVGDTLAAGKLYRLLERFGEDVLRTALRCITRTRKGYPGLVRPQLVEAFCVNLEAEPDWCGNEAALLKAMHRLDLAETYKAALAAAAGSRADLVAKLVDTIAKHLDEHFDKVAA